MLRLQVEAHVGAVTNPEAVKQAGYTVAIQSHHHTHHPPSNREVSPGTPRNHHPPTNPRSGGVIPLVRKEHSCTTSQ